MDFASMVFGGSLALVRIASMVLTAPVLGNRSVPFRFKALLALLLTTVTFPLINLSTTIPTEIDGWTRSLFSELAIGIFLGLGVQIVFAAAQMTGTIMSQMAAMQIGNGSDTLGGEGSPVSKLLAVLSIAAFVLMGGPEQVVGATINTFVAVPVGTSLQTAGLIDLMIELLRQSFLLTLRGVAPAMAAIMVSTFAIGLISRNYPQIDLMNMGLASNLCVMLLALLFTLGGSVWLFADDFRQVVNTIQEAIVASDRDDLATFGPAPTGLTTPTGLTNEHLAAIEQPVSASTTKTTTQPVDWQTTNQTDTYATHSSLAPMSLSRRKSVHTYPVASRLLPTKLEDPNWEVAR